MQELQHQTNNQWTEGHAVLLIKLPGASAASCMVDAVASFLLIRHICLCQWLGHRDFYVHSVALIHIAIWFNYWTVICSYDSNLGQMIWTQRFSIRYVSLFNSDAAMQANNRDFTHYRWVQLFSWKLRTEFSLLIHWMYACFKEPPILIENN